MDNATNLFDLNAGGPAPAPATIARDPFSQTIATLQAARAKSLLFIGGMPKSGSTWLQILLNAHPEIACAGEGHLMSRFAPALRDTLVRQNDYIRNKNQSVFSELPPFPLFADMDFRLLMTTAITLLMARSAGHRDAKVIGEKTPNNILYFPILESMFPNAKFLHIVRDGRDCGVSAWFHNLRVNAKAILATHPALTDYLTDHAKLWNKTVIDGLDFGTRHPGRYRTVRYEDLVVHPSETLKQILRFLDVTSTGTIIAQCIDNGSFVKLSGGRPRGQEDRDSFFRRGVAGDWRNHLTPEMNAAFCQAAGPAMSRTGYLN